MYMSVGRCGHLGYTRSRKVPESMRQLIWRADLRTMLNLAEPVTDGMKLEVPSKAQAGDPAWQAQNQNALTGNRDAGNSVAGQHVLVNLNTASLEELMTLKGIGTSRAEDIIRYRKEAGGFTKIEDIMKVPGIKDAAFQKIKENITV